MNTPNKIIQPPPLPPFTRETATEKVRLAENGWNSRDPEKVALAYTVDSWWRNRAEFVQGRPAIIDFLTRKWKKELDYRLIKELWAFDGSRIAMRFASEWHDDSNKDWGDGAPVVFSHGRPLSSDAFVTVIAFSCLPVWPDKTNFASISRDSPGAYSVFVKAAVLQPLFADAGQARAYPETQQWLAVADRHTP